MVRRNSMLQPFLQVLAQDNGVVMIRISRREQQRDHFLAGKHLYRFQRLGACLQLTAVLFLELRPSLRIVSELPAQFVAWRKIPEPNIDCGPFPGEPARPHPIYENPQPIAPVRSLVYTLHANEGHLLVCPSSEFVGLSCRAGDHLPAVQPKRCITDTTLSVKQITHEPGPSHPHRPDALPEENAFRRGAVWAARFSSREENYSGVIHAGKFNSLRGSALRERCLAEASPIQTESLPPADSSSACESLLQSGRGTCIRSM